jgi:hypothetical protein
MTLHDMPLTGGDLRDIADAADEVDATTLAALKVLGRIEVMRPDDEQGERVGWLTRFDLSDPDMGWGFVPEDPS